MDTKLFLLKTVFIFRERGRDGEREGEKHQRVKEALMGCLSHALNRAPGQRPRHVVP